MKEYKKPRIEEEVIVVEDIIAASNEGETKSGISVSLEELFKK